jgi:tetratricopeptide (TPR) repeat protein
MLADASAAIARALALAPDEPDTLRVSLMMEPVAPDWAAVERSLLAARARWPNAAGLLFDHGRILLQVGRQADAVPVLAEALRLDPLHAASASAYASALRAAGRVPEAEAIWTDLIRRYPTAPQPFFSLVFSLSGRGDFDAIDGWVTPERLDRFPEGSERMRNILFGVQAKRTGGEEMRRRMTKIAEMAANVGRLPLSFAAVLSEFCDLDWLYGLLARTPVEDLRRPGGRLDAGDGTLEVLFLQEFARLRSDARFVDLCGKLGFAGYWLETGAWPDFGAEVDYDLGAECRRVAGKNR